MSDLGDFHAQMEALMRSKAESDRVAGTKPAFLPDVNQLLFQQMFYHANMLPRWQISQGLKPPTSPNQTMRISSTTAIYPSSTARMEDLTPTFLKDLVYERQHRGRYITVTVISQVAPSTAAQMVVQDAKGDAVTMGVYNCWDRRQDLDFVIPKGSKITIKEPYFKKARDGKPNLRVDHISDIVIAKDCRQLALTLGKSLSSLELKNASFLKDWGNEMFKQGNHLVATYLYSEALTCSNNLTKELREILHLNRAQAYLKLGDHYESAIADATLAASQLNNAKAHFRLAMGYYQARQFPQARKSARTALSTIGNNTADFKRDIEALLERTNRRLKEQATGEYDFTLMRNLVVKDHLSELDFADYLSPSVEMRQATDMGTGVFTKKDIKRGDLVLAEKAFAMARHNPKDMVILMNLFTKEMRADASAGLAEFLVQKLFANPESAARFFALYSGDYPRVSVDASTHRPLEVDNRPVIDTFLVDRIRSLNGFGCTSLTMASHDKERQPDSTISITGERDKDVGLWILASRFNHSCLPNVTRAFVGDMMLVRANADIPAGTQLYMGYTGPREGQSYTERKDQIKRAWGFVCRCSLCTADGNMTSQLAEKQRKLGESIKSALQQTREAAGRLPSPSAVVIIERAMASAITDVAALKKTYARAPAPSAVPHIALAQSYGNLSSLRSYYSRAKRVNQYDECLAASHAGLKALGFEFVETPSLEPNQKAVEIKKWGYVGQLAMQFTWQSCLSWSMRAAQVLGAGSENMAVALSAMECQRVAQGWEEVTKQMFKVNSGCEEGFEEYFDNDVLTAAA